MRGLCKGDVIDGIFEGGALILLFLSPMLVLNSNGCLRRGLLVVLLPLKPLENGVDDLAGVGGEGMLVVGEFDLVCIMAHMLISMVYITDNLLTVQSLLVEGIATHFQHILDLSKLHAIKFIKEKFSY